MGRLGCFSHIVSNVLTVFVFIDLFKTFVDYRVHEEVRITDYHCYNFNSHAWNCGRVICPKIWFSIYLRPIDIAADIRYGESSSYRISLKAHVNHFSESRIYFLMANVNPQHYYRMRSLPRAYHCPIPYYIYDYKLGTYILNSGSQYHNHKN